MRPSILGIQVRFTFSRFHSLYRAGLDEVMKGNPDVVGEKAAFDWSVLDNALSGSASRHMHAVWRVIMDFPGKPLQVPRYLLDAGIEMRGYDGGTSPYYGDSQLLEAVEQFVTRMGKRYDGDKRLAFVQAGIVGFWGEWHTGGVDAIPDGVTDQLVGWYASSFTKTKIQLRYSLPSGYKAGFGRHDDSFAFETLDGEANGGVVRDYYFWPDVVKQKQNDFWKRGVMGGETRGHLQQEIFEPWYSARTFEKQDFMDCVTTTHTTYIFHHSAFREGGFTGTELTNARHAHARMGYNFYVSEVAAKASSATQQVNIDVTVKQIGVAPFYYDLSLGLRCPGMTKKTVAGVNSLIDNGSTKVFSFSGIPATTACLDSVSLSLESSYAYQKRPIKFAQGNGTVAFSLPLPGGAPTAPVASPLRQSNANPSPATATVTTDQGGSNPLFGRIFYTFTAFLQHIASSF